MSSAVSKKRSLVASPPRKLRQAGGENTGGLAAEQNNLVGELEESLQNLRAAIEQGENMMRKINFLLDNQN